MTVKPPVASSSVKSISEGNHTERTIKIGTIPKNPTTSNAPKPIKRSLIDSSSESRIFIILPLCIIINRT